MGRDYMRDLYIDFFGDGGSGGKKAEESGKTETPGGGADAARPDLTPTEEAEVLRLANDALRDVYALFGNRKPDGGREPVSPAGGGMMNPGQAGAAPDQQGQIRKTEQSQAVSSAPEAEAEEETDPMEELNGLIGLATIKKDVKELVDFVKVQKLRKEEGLKSVPVSLHLVFTGNPGTGKTTVARIIAKLYHKIGVLPKGQLVEVDRSGLVAGYMGQTAIRTAEQIEKAMGGVLFIDEAYSLAKKDDTFGEEAIDTILKAMEDHRDELVVIVAGYTKPMENFISSNPGLRSRFTKYIEFPDYTEEELYDIFLRNCGKYDYTLTEEAALAAKKEIARRRKEKRKDFANAREVRNLFEAVITQQAKRLAAADHPDAGAMKEITEEDVKGILPEEDGEKTELLQELFAGIRDMDGEEGQSAEGNAEE